MINGLTNNQLVGSVVIVDSDISNTGTFVDMVSVPCPLLPSADASRLGLQMRSLLELVSSFWKTLH